ncbi:MAG: TetR/AcrR family transcriptional regulator [Rhizobiales bacterium]|nr:TetR/AcrR family transcriptional regulator [Hyphomicrobiales bacterium]
MPLEKKFNIDDALKHAMDVFWVFGFEASSTQKLLASMNINRGSLYATFGNKQSLFIKALRLYIISYQTKSLDMLSNIFAPCEAITQLFQQVIASALADDERRGCFLVNTLLDLSAHEQEVQKLATAAIDQIELFFNVQIAAGQNTGAISKSIDKQKAASALLGLLLGIRVLSRIDPNKERLIAIQIQAENILV